MRKLVFLGLIASASVSLAQKPEGFAWYEDGKAATTNASRSSMNGFGAMMVITPDADAFWKAWEGPTLPNLPVTNSVKLGHPVHAMLVFGGCKAGPDGKCDVVATFSMIAPNGQPYDHPVTAQAWAGPPAPGYNLQLSEASLGFRLEQSDAAGLYTVRATVTDRVADVTLTVEQKVQGIK